MKPWTFAILVVGILGLATLGGEIGRTLLVGWIGFLTDVVPRVTVRWDGVVMAVVSLALLTALIDYLARWWCRAAPVASDSPPRRWRLRWSVSIMLTIILMFVTAISAMGVARQTGWVLSSQEPLFATYGGYGTSVNNLKLVGLAIQNYAELRGALPAGGTFDERGQMLHSWETAILPYLPYMSDSIDMKLPWNHPKNAPFFRGPVPEFVNPDFRVAPLTDDDGFGLSHYAANSHVLRANHGMKLSDATDGTANTILVGEVNARFQPWGHPVNYRDPTLGINQSSDGFGGAPASHGAQFMMMDGSVRSMSQDTDPAVLKAFATPSGGDNPQP